MLSLVKLFFGDMEKIITSKNNPLIKDIAKLKLKKNRQDTFLIEGERFVFEALKRNITIKYLLYVEPPIFLKDFKGELIKISMEIAVHLSDTVNTSGVFAVVEYKEKQFTKPQGNFLILDKIADPGNLGTIIRTALAFNYKDIYLIDCVDWRNDKVLRSTMGTIFDVNLFNCNINDIMPLKQYKILKAEMNGTNFNKITYNKEQLGLLLGNEANGISQEISKISNESVSIPMQNSVESLNVSVAGAILMSKYSN